MEFPEVKKCVKCGATWFEGQLRWSTGAWDWWTQQGLVCDQTDPEFYGLASTREVETWRRYLGKESAKIDEMEHEMKAETWQTKGVWTRIIKSVWRKWRSTFGTHVGLSTVARDLIGWLSWHMESGNVSLLSMIIDRRCTTIKWQWKEPNPVWQRTSTQTCKSQQTTMYTIFCFVGWATGLSCVGHWFESIDFAWGVGVG